MNLDAGGESFSVRILAGRNFPFEPPSIWLEDTTRFLRFPHVEKSGKLCLLDGASTASPQQAAAVTLHLVEDARRLLAESLHGTNRDDFLREFQSYWRNSGQAHARPFWTTLKPEGPSRPVFLWSARGLVLFAESAEDCRRWVQCSCGGKVPDGYMPQPTVLAWLNAPLFPDEYPKTAAAVLRLIEARAPEAKAILTSVTPREPGALPLLLGFGFEGSPIFAGLEIREPTGMSSSPGGRAMDIRTQGFRAGKIPPDVLVSRYFGSNQIELAEVTRVDESWLLARGGNALDPLCANWSVALVGCGSIGADVAFLLAKSGVRRLVLIDPDALSWSNVGRHLLGGDHVPQPKAAALADFLKRQMPWMEISTVTCSLGEVLSERPQVLKNCDLIISTAGDWPCDCQLNCAHRSSGRFPPVVFGWTEAYGMAGQALAVLDSGGCLACGMNELGVFDHRVTDWPRASGTLRRAVGCSEVYQPYGVMDVAPTKAMIAELALDVLHGRVLRSEHRTWIGGLDRLTQLEGTVRPGWQSRGSSSELSKRFFRSAWLSNPHCPLCLP